jgi:hypothetical protein
VKSIGHVLFVFSKSIAMFTHSNDLGEACLYCSRHENDVVVKLPTNFRDKLGLEAPKPPKKQTAAKTINAPENTLERKQMAAKPINAPENTLEKYATANKMSKIPRKAPNPTPSPAVPMPSKRKTTTHSVDLGTVLPSLSIPRKKKQKIVNTNVAKPSETAGRTSPLPPGARRGHQWGRKPKDRYAELDSSTAVAVNAGDRPTLKNNRRELADQKSKLTENKVQLVLIDLLKNVPNPSADKEKSNAAVRGRKLFWKREFSELNPEDFKALWLEARRKFTAVQSSKSSSNEKNVKQPPEKSVASQKTLVSDKEIIDLLEDDDDEETAGDGNPKKSSQKDDANVGDTDPNKDAPAQSTAEAKVPPKRYHDRWSHLFVGPSYRMGNEFHLTDFEEYL